MVPYFKNDNVEIYHGDSEIILGQLSVTPDLFLTDPPYGINYQNNYTHSQHQKLIGDVEKFYYKNWSLSAFNLLKEGSAVFAFTGWSEYPQHYNDLKDSGFKMKEPLIVQKRASGTSDLYGSFQTNSDWLLFGSKGKFKFRQTNLLKNKKAGVIPNKGRKPVPEYKTRFPSCWFGPEFPWSTENPGSVKQWRHPTIKSVEFLKWLILISTDNNNLIVDPFMGSGSSLVAACQSGRRSIGIEIEEEFCEIAVQRLNQLI